ncbi:MAG: membrane protein [Flavobacterium sp.]|jgi:membrane protein
MIALFQVTKNAFSGFLEHKALKMSAALAYTTMFSLGLLLLMIFFI